MSAIFKIYRAATAALEGLVSTTTQVFGGGKTIDGNADEIQLKVQGHGTQTANIFEIEDSTGQNLVTVDPDGDITLDVASAAGASSPKITMQSYNGSSVSKPTTLESRWDSGNGQVVTELIGPNGSAGLAIYESGLISLNSAGNGVLEVNNTIRAVNGTVVCEGTSAGQIGFIARGRASQTANLQEWQDNSSNVYATVSENGYFTTRKVAAPADAELSASEGSFWWDDTDGAAAMKVKGKSADGTVVTATIASSEANLRATEGGGTTTLTVSDNPYQVFTLTSAHTVQLPTTSVTEGYVITLENRGDFALTVQSSGANTIDTLYVGKIVLRSTQASPTTAAHWIVVDIHSTSTATPTLVGATTSPSVTIKQSRVNKTVQLHVASVGLVTKSGNGQLTFPLSTGFAATDGFYIQRQVVNNTAQSGVWRINSTTVSMFNGDSGINIPDTTTNTGWDFNLHFTYYLA